MDFKSEANDLSTKSFFERPKNFTAVEPETPWEKAEGIWDKRVGSVVQQNYNLRRFVKWQTILQFILIAGLIFCMTRSTTIPYVVRVNDTTGEVTNIGVAAQASYTPKDAEIEYLLKHFIINTRRVLLDQEAYKDQWREAADFMTKSCFAKMNADYTSSGRNKLPGTKTVSVNISSVLPIKGEGDNSDRRSYQVNWTEEEFALNSGERVSIPMSGVFTLEVIPQKDKSLVLRNPLGIYVTDFNWQKAATAPQKNNSSNK